MWIFRLQESDKSYQSMLQDYRQSQKIQGIAIQSFYLKTSYNCLFIKSLLFC